MHKASAAEVLRSFSRSVDRSELEALNFLSPWVRDDQVLFVNKQTGAVSADPSVQTLRAVDYWTKQVFTSDSEDDYNAHMPYARARLLYVLQTVIDYLGIKERDSLGLADLAAGQGVFLDLARAFSPSLQLTGTEHSGELVQALRDRGFDVWPTPIFADMEARFQSDIATLNWTLSCCDNPCDVVAGARKHLRTNGHLVVAESSRVLVPFRKSLTDLFGTVHPTHMHPWYFSARSVSALLIASGFRIQWVNRFFDSDVLVVIAQKVEPPSEDFQISVDDPRLVVDFFRRWAATDGYFEELRSEQSDLLET